MTKILIASRKHDTHSIILAQALTANGHSAFRWINADFPEKQRLSFTASNGIMSRMTITECTSVVDEAEIDVVWLRRPTWAVMPSDLHPSDKALATQECNHFIRSFWQASFRRATWVNSLEGRRAANSKLLQLKLAAEVGLSVPTSLISNDPDEIKLFISNSIRGVIVKPLLGGGVQDDDGHQRHIFTAKLTLNRLPQPQYIQACPCIYQVEISKAYEVRATFFGATVVAVRIDSQGGSNTKIDWRAGYGQQLSLSEIEMPSNVFKLCRRLMSGLSIIHGSFDFAVTPDGEWIFFEVNEGGQFLWIESAAPEINILEVASKFLAEPSFDFQYKSEGPIRKMSDIVKSPVFRKSYGDDQRYNDDQELSAVV